MFRFYMDFKVASKCPPDSIRQASRLFLRFAVDLLIISCGIVCACKSEKSGCQMVRLFRVQELINKTSS